MKELAMEMMNNGYAIKLFMTIFVFGIEIHNFEGVGRRA